MTWTKTNISLLQVRTTVWRVVGHPLPWSVWQQWANVAELFSHFRWPAKLTCSVIQVWWVVLADCSMMARHFQLSAVPILRQCWDINAVDTPNVDWCGPHGILIYGSAHTVSNVITIFVCVELFELSKIIYVYFFFFSHWRVECCIGPTHRSQ